MHSNFYHFPKSIYEAINVFGQQYYKGISKEYIMELIEI